MQIDNLRVWGEDGDIPSYSLILTVKLKGKNVRIPTEAFRDLYEPRLSILSVLTSDMDRKMLVTMSNSDGAGGYMVAWLFLNGLYRGRTIVVP